MCKWIAGAKDQLVSETNGEHQHREGDQLIRQAFDGFVKMYFDEIQGAWQNDIQLFIDKYEKMAEINAT